ncbi:hypothetical protein PICMEDRAFT_17840, partial [Pichia membranifaciens NRRL Y-2026]
MPSPLPACLPACPSDYRCLFLSPPARLRTHSTRTPASSANENARFSQHVAKTGPLALAL